MGPPAGTGSLSLPTPSPYPSGREVAATLMRVSTTASVLGTTPVDMTVSPV